jgi:hypothetical protein
LARAQSFYTAAFGLSSFFFATPPPGAQAAVRTYEGTVRTGNVTGRGWGYKAHQKMFHVSPVPTPPARRYRMVRREIKHLTPLGYMSSAIDL